LPEKMILMENRGEIIWMNECFQIFD